MEQKKNQQTIDSQEKKHSDNLIKQMKSQPCNPADLWGCAADSFPQNKHNYRRIGDAFFILARALDSITICNFA